MREESKTFYYKGWFGVCPVLISDANAAIPALAPRHKALGWLFDISETYYRWKFRLLTRLSPDYLPLWPINVSGRLENPIELRGEYDKAPHS